MSKIVVPATSVRRNASSSAYAIALMRAKFSVSSGYDGAMAAMLTGSSSGNTGSSTPSRRIERTERRMMRRST